MRGAESNELSSPFSDGLSGKESQAATRYLGIGEASDDQCVMDFRYAYNFPNVPTAASTSVLFLQRELTRSEDSWGRDELSLLMRIVEHGYCLLAGTILARNRC